MTATSPSEPLRENENNDEPQFAAEMHPTESNRILAGLTGDLAPLHFLTRPGWLARAKAYLFPDIGSVQPGQLWIDRAHPARSTSPALIFILSISTDGLARTITILRGSPSIIDGKPLPVAAQGQTSPGITRKQCRQIVRRYEKISTEGAQALGFSV